MSYPHVSMTAERQKRTNLEMYLALILVADQDCFLLALSALVAGFLTLYSRNLI